MQNHCEHRANYEEGNEGNRMITAFGNESHNEQNQCIRGEDVEGRFAV